MKIVGEFKFNDTEYFTNLLAVENVSDEKKEEILKSLNLDDVNYRILYKKDNEGTKYKQCLKGNERINAKDIPVWIKTLIWDYEREIKFYTS